MELEKLYWVKCPKKGKINFAFFHVWYLRFCVWVWFPINSRNLERPLVDGYIKVWKLIEKRIKENIGSWYTRVGKFFTDCTKMWVTNNHQGEMVTKIK